MSTCSNCYSGCVEIQSDKCVKYTGINLEALGINNGDTLNSIVSSITTFLISTLDGSGVKYELDTENMCTIVSNEFIGNTDVTQKDISNALSKVICSIDSRVAILENARTTLEAPYSPGCIPGITGQEGTRIILQAVITKLCETDTSLQALSTNLSTNYVLISDIETYISNYLSEQGADEPYYKNNMVPYSVIEYYGPLNVFDASGAGLGLWEEIYLCNGDNGTPDKRGRIAVGATTGMSGGALPNATDPAINGNPSYSLYTTTGENTVTLTTAQMPAHSHTASLSSDGAHTHSFPATLYTKVGASGDNNTFTDKDNTGAVNVTETLSAGSHTHTVSVNSIGGGNSHNNIPPVLACYYIMYIPTV